MIYSFITDEDLKVAGKQYFIDELTTDANILPIAEGAAFSMMKAKLNNRYDLKKLFPLIINWDSATTFAKDSYCYSSGKIYIALQAATNQIPASQPTYWKLADPRDQLLVLFASNMTIYILFQRNKPSKISDDMQNNYAAALEWLESAKGREESPDWPTLDTGTENIPWGSNNQQQHYY